MNMMRAIIATFFKIPSAKYSGFTSRLVSNRLYILIKRIKCYYVCHLDKNVDDRLGSQAWNGSASNMVNPDRDFAQCLNQKTTFLLKKTRPYGIIFDDFYIPHGFIPYQPTHNLWLA